MGSLLRGGDDRSLMSVDASFPIPHVDGKKLPGRIGSDSYPEIAPEQK
jgi:hypothetical protein